MPGEDVLIIVEFNSMNTKNGRFSYGLITVFPVKIRGLKTNTGYEYNASWIYRMRVKGDDSLKEGSIFSFLGKIYQYPQLKN